MIIRDRTHNAFFLIEILGKRKTCVQFADLCRWISTQNGACVAIESRFQSSDSFRKMLRLQCRNVTDRSPPSAFVRRGHYSTPYNALRCLGTGSARSHCTVMGASPSQSAKLTGPA